MRVGLPKGLLYTKYYPFFYTFIKNLRVEVVISEDTNKDILNKGVKYSVDEACLPIKIFHGHVASIKDKCDLIIIPRIMYAREREYICPKFCGLPEMIKNSIPGMPPITEIPLNINSEKSIYKWSKKVGFMITSNLYLVETAYLKAKKAQEDYKCGLYDKKYKMNILLLGHPYNIYDTYVNMDLVKKLHKLNVGVRTEECIPQKYIDMESNKLFKKPFWVFAKNGYGAASYAMNEKNINGIIYVSSFACGIDSVVIELIKDKISNFPFLVLKIDEQTGEAGLNTRIEAFIDMLERRCRIENNISTYGKRVHCR